eukprot:COSAG02_NODE_1598_length_11761_cov_15.902418_10_plen_125_part_00
MCTPASTADMQPRPRIQSGVATRKGAREQGRAARADFRDSRRRVQGEQQGVAARRTTSGTVFMRLSFMLSDSSWVMLPSSAGMSSRPFKLTFRTVRSHSCEAKTVWRCQRRMSQEPARRNNPTA